MRGQRRRKSERRLDVAVALRYRFGWFKRMQAIVRHKAELRIFVDFWKKCPPVVENLWWLTNVVCMCATDNPWAFSMRRRRSRSVK
jgi:hypothetical protein